MENKFNDSEFDKVAETEKWLINYKSIKAGIESLKEKYEVSNDVGSEMDDSKKATLDLLDSRIRNMQRKIEQIDRALAALNKVEREIVTYKCIDGMYYYEFTYKVYKSERQCKRIKKIALKKMSIALGL
ncbi:hypothetical protein D9O40_00815 [Clostridium autoethanogenum]|uniref:Uncharacterized protein n=1 Tax=Clostridium autoethanogenum TaxID=84023 RepID=A0A3M0T2R5_9CLOT|nr:hypothetical protein [Clostridium autoethanogenum]RMD04923.1 hypothetical protein D9O40_00815 [Clostridium autoethanogenum]